MVNYSLCHACHSTGSQRPLPPLPPLQEIVQRYGRVADSVNQKSFSRFVEFVRERWDPLPPAQEEWADDDNHTYRGEGWTEEGAFAMCIHKLAFWPSGDEIDRGEPLCEAEKRNQVSFRPVESFIDDFPRPLSYPCSEKEIFEKVSLLREGLQKQSDEFITMNNITAEVPADFTVELPTDFEEFMRITDGVKGAGVPSETGRLTLVMPLKYNTVEAQMPGASSATSAGSEFNWWRGKGYNPLAAWELGGCSGWRMIYYVLCRDSDEKNADSPPTWKVFDHYDVEVIVYDNLSQFIQHETDHIEVTPGGHQSSYILDSSDRYPDRSRFG